MLVRFCGGFFKLFRIRSVINVTFLLPKSCRVPTSELKCTDSTFIDQHLFILFLLRSAVFYCY